MRLLLCAILTLLAVDALSQDMSLAAEANGIGSDSVLSFNRIPYVYASAKGSDVLWDFSNVQDDGNEDIFRITHLSDSIIEVSSSKEILNLHMTRTGMYVSHRESPLYKTDYPEKKPLVPFPFHYGDSISIPFKGEGTYCGDHVYIESGRSEFSADAQGALVLGKDTLKDVLQIRSLCDYELYMDADSMSLDVASRKNIREDIHYWYARGYRYPVLLTVRKSVFDKVKPVTVMETAYLFPPDSQSLLVDRVNEEIRKKSVLAKSSETRFILDTFHYTISNNGNVFTLKCSTEGTVTVKACVCDSRGIIYRQQQSECIKGEEFILHFDCQSLRKGQYIIYINVGGAIYNDKVVVS